MKQALFPLSSPAWQRLVSAASEQKTIALTGAKLMTDDALLTRAKAEFKRRTDKTPYRCPIPQGIVPKF